MSYARRFVSRDEIISARAASLYDFVLARHGCLVRKSGQSLYMKDHDSIYIKKGFPGYNDFSTDKHGNPIDFLMKHLGYSFIEAVVSLNEFSTCRPLCHSDDKTETAIEGLPVPVPIHLPPPADRPFRNMYAYLMGRGIPSWMIRKLEHAGLAYQDREHNNVVFVNREKDYCELRGTFTYAGRPFHGCRKSGPDRFWYMSAGTGKPEMAYICEAAIDAISLCLIHKGRRLAERSLYVSIGGVSNQQAIQRIKGIMPVTLAVDNDRAGEECRARNDDIPSIIPVHKDWNDDLQDTSLQNSNVLL